MLVLSRKRSERILIGDWTWITVSSLECGRVRLTFSLPKTVPVLRCEFLLLRVGGADAGGSEQQVEPDRPEVSRLTLSRKVGEAVSIGDDVFVAVTAIDRGKARLGIDAPKGVLIFREELLPEARRYAEVFKDLLAPQGPWKNVVV